MYEKFFKRLFDFLIALCGIICLSPVFVMLIILGAIKMKGNPFFTQERPGKNEKIFKLIKFRTMTCERDENGELLSDDDRLTRYGKLLRSTSLDELPEFFNILKGDMSFVGPRPLLVKYLPLYNKEQKRRHEVRPGLTGYAQVNGRNSLTWEQKFQDDVEYVDNISLALDIKILIKTVTTVLKREGISQENNVTMEEFKGASVKEEVIK